MSKELSKICGNCANGCMINPYEKFRNFNTIFCTKWIETIPAHHGCIDFVTHENAGYMHFQNDLKNKINKINYPFDDLNV